MTGITRFGLDVSRVTIIVLVLIVVGGITQFLNFPRSEDPSIVIREVVIAASFEGMPPRDIEQLITRPIETELRSMPEIDDIWSESKNGQVVVHADTRDEYEDVDGMWQKVRNRMADLAPKLPEGTVGPVVNDEFGLTAVATIALWSDGFTLEEMRRTARDIREELYELSGIRKVELWGVHDENVYLGFSTARLARAGLTVAQIVETLEAQNVVLPGGHYDVAGQDIVVEPTGNFRSIDDVSSVLVAVPGTDRSVRVRDLLEVERAYADPASEFAYYNGQRSVVISVSTTAGVNAVEFGARLKAKVADIQSRVPVGYVLEFATFQPDLVHAAISGAMSNVYQTLVIVMVVVVLFLGVRTGLIVGSFVPLTMLLGLLVMSFFGIELERVSIASAIIALGMLVDNGIVIAEEIRNRLEAGEERYEACLATSRALAIPLLTSSLTTILAFVPMLLLTGQTGEYAYSLPMVVTILLLSSWFLSMYMTPFMSFQFMTVEAKSSDAATSAEEGGFYVAYRRLLDTLLGRRLLVIAVVGLVLVLGGAVATQLVRVMFGPSDRNQLLLYLDLPAGYNITNTDAIVRDVGSWLADDEVNPEITGTIAYVGTGGPRFVLVLAPMDPDPNRAFFIVNTESGDQVPTVASRIREHVADNIPEVEGRVKRMWTSGQEPGLLEIRLIGPDPDVLYAKSRELRDSARAIPGTRDVFSDWENKVMKVKVVVDQARARRAGVTSESVASSLRAHIDGVEATSYREQDTAIPVVLRSVDEERSTASQFVNIHVAAPERGESVALTQIADFEATWDFSRIARRNLERVVSVELKHESLRSPELLERMMPEIEALDLPEGYRWEPGAEIEQQGETMPKLFQYMPHCLLLIFTLLIWQFNSFRRALIIGFTLPLAFCGAFFGVFLMGAPFDFFAILGLLSLAGIIINNGIVLIDRIDIERKAGKPGAAAIVEACVARFRPILMTTVTTLLGVMPLIVSHDPVFYSMAIIIGSGLVFGTMLTLGVVPVLYSLFFHLSRDENPAP